MTMEIKTILLDLGACLTSDKNPVERIVWAYYKANGKFYIEYE